MPNEQLQLTEPHNEAHENAADLQRRLAQLAVLPPRIREEKEPSEAAVDQGHGHVPSYTEIGLRRLPEAREVHSKAVEDKPKHRPPEAA